MQSKSLSKLVKRVFSNEVIKEQFISNPESIMSQFKLTKQEEKAVLSAHSKMALAHPGSSQTVMNIEPLVMWL